MMTMKKVTLLALIAALVVSLVAGTAVAKPKPSKPPKKEKRVTYIFHGTVTEVTQAGTDPETGLPLTDPQTGQPLKDSVTVDVKQGNKPAKSYIGQQVTFAVNEEADLADVQVGDVVKVQVKAPASANSDSFTARQLQVKE